MAVLNQTDSTDTGVPQSDGGQSQQSSSGGQIDKFNDLLENVNKILENDFVKQRIANKANQNQGRQVMGQGQPQGQPPQQALPAEQGRPSQPPQDHGMNQGQPPTQDGGDVQETPGEFDLRDYFAEKVKTEDGRQELKEQIDALTEYLDPDATLEQIQEELEDEEFIEQIEQLKEMGAI